MKSIMMICPVCTVELVLVERQGIEIDYCPQCRGLWLDRGELEKLIERSTSTPDQESYRRERYSQRHEDQHHGYESRGHYRDSHNDGHRGEGHRERRSFLGDLFDF